MGLPLPCLVALLAVACIPQQTRGQTEHLRVLGYAPALSAADLGDDSTHPRYSAEGSFEFSTAHPANLVVFVGNWPASADNATACVLLVENAQGCTPESGQLFKNISLEKPPLAENCSGQAIPCSGSVWRAVVPLDSMGILSPKAFYFCTPALDQMGACGPRSLLEHQGNLPWLTIHVSPPPGPMASFELPLAVKIVFVLLLLLLSGLFSGLNLGLMSLDLTSLKIVSESGTKRQKWCAKMIYPVRRHGNYLLCTILLSNVAVNSTIAIFMTDLTSGAIAVVGSTLAIVIFGEIIPQAVCSRFGLYVGAYTIPLTWLAMLITLPLSLPLSLILSLVLGKELGASYNREELLQLLKITKGKTDIQADEVDMIFGALQLRQKEVQEAMTRLPNVYCLDIDRRLDFETIQEIHESGHSRIPLYEGERSNIVSILYTRNLAFIDPEDEMGLRQYHSFYRHKPLEEWGETRLDVMLERFVQERVHMAVVKRVDDENPDRDPVYETIGIITLEDIIEEILQKEIIDETDRFVNNEMQEPISAKQERVAVRDIVGAASTAASLSAAQRLALFQFLSASVEPFSEDHISPAILRRLLHTDDLSCEVAFDEKNPSLIYEAGKPANFFTVVVEGQVQVEIGNEKLKFECRSFSHFGVQALCNILSCPSQPEQYVPDFTVHLAANCLLFTVTQHEYSLAYRTSLLSRQKEGEGNGEGSDPQPPEEEQFCSEWRKMEEEDSGAVAGDGLSTLARWRKKKRRKQRQPQRVGYRPLLSEEETDWVSIDVEPLVEAGPAVGQHQSTSHA